ncbi:MAG: hypothetical protein IJF03_01255 [Lachnospiraceae bacterium]|nr:hypothetical protein [Lachnospiraceae bacterium]
MKKKIIAVVTSCIAIAIIAGGISVFAKGGVKYFTGKEGEVITVYLNEDVPFNGDVEIVGSTDETYKVGDVIQANGHQEKVIAVSEDGCMITEELTE